MDTYQLLQGTLINLVSFALDIQTCPPCNGSVLRKCTGARCASLLPIGLTPVVVVVVVVVAAAAAAAAAAAGVGVVVGVATSS